MRKNLFSTLIIIGTLTAGCTDKTPANAAIVTPASSEKSVDSGKTSVLITTATPTEKVVLANVYKQLVQETTNSQLSDGRYASYWTGQQFSRDGKNYFVAFTEATPPSEIEYPAPEDKVTISQVTYELANNQWQLKSVQDDVGQFGGNNKAPTVDAARKAEVFNNVQGKLFLSAPSVLFANMGIQLFSSEIFVFSPENGKWKYLGSVKTGSDNTAGCSHEADSATKTKCASSNGKLQFSAIENSDWPELKIVFEGTGLDDGGNLITLSGKNSLIYRYDEKSSAYVEVSK